MTLNFATTKNQSKLHFSQINQIISKSVVEVNLI